MILNPNGAPVSTPPAERVIERPITPARLQDNEGTAEISIQSDVTLMEVWHISNMLMWCITQPPSQRDHHGTLVHVHTMWRKYIEENALQRHFIFSMSIPLQDPGHA